MQALAGGVIEFAMVFAVGALVAALLALLSAPLVARHARRVALVDLQHRMPMSMGEIAAERDALRARHALELRRLEQHIGAMEHRVAASMSEAGRQTTRLVTLDQRAAADRDAIAALDAALREAKAACARTEEVVAQQVRAMADTQALATQRGEQAEAAGARVTTLDATVTELRQQIAALQTRLDKEAGPERPAMEPLASEGLAPSPTSNGTDPDSTVVTRLRAEQDLTAKALAATNRERDRLRLRIDELLLKIEDLEDKREEATEDQAEQRRHAARQAKAIETLTARLGARDAALAAARQRLNDASTGPGTAEGVPTTAPALRQAIADLAENLVAFATRPAEPPETGAGGPTS